MKVTHIGLEDTQSTLAKKLSRLADKRIDSRNDEEP